MQSLTQQTLKIFWQHAIKYKWQAALLALGVIITTLTDLYRPFLYKNLLNTLALGDTGKTPQLIGIVWMILIVSSIHSICWRVILFINSFFQPRVMSDLVNTCYEYLMGHSYNFFSGNFVGSLVTRVRRYERAFENIADQVYYNIGRTMLNAAIIIAVLYFRHWVLGTLILIWCLLYLIFAVLFARYRYKYDTLKATQDTKTTGHMADTITNSVNIKLFSSLTREVGAFSQITDKLFRLRRTTWNIGNYAEAVQGALAVVLEFGMMYAAVIYWARGILTIGDFILIQSYIIILLDKLWEVGRQMRAIYENLADAREMTEILLAPHEVVDISGAAVLAASQGKIEFKNVTFVYGKGSPVLKNFNLQIRPGERAALIGPSGGGKSTIVKILLRFIDIQGGEILIDGQNVAGVTQDSLRQNIALVPQEPILFHRSLMENIRYGRAGASDKAVIAAAKLAHAHEFISGFEHGYQTFVGERGVKLSGGERQRVAIARAILKNAPILILDEATSSLDSESEMYIQDALKNLMRDKTVIVIAHRLSTIMQMDRIIVLENGKITEQGKHEELVKTKQGTYQRLWQIQAGGFA